MSKSRVVILGGCFAGIECGKAFRRRDDVEVTLVDRQNHHLFQPLLYQVASAGLAAPEIAHPIRSIFRGQENITVLMDEVTAIDLGAREVKTREGEIPYDYLVVSWLMWLFIHLIFLVGFRNRIAVLMQWFYAYVRYRRGARIITGLDRREGQT